MYEKGRRRRSIYERGSWSVAGVCAQRAMHVAGRCGVPAKSVHATRCEGMARRCDGAMTRLLPCPQRDRDRELLAGRRVQSSRCRSCGHSGSRGETAQETQSVAPGHSLARERFDKSITNGNADADVAACRTLWGEIHWACRHSCSRWQPHRLVCRHGPMLLHNVAELSVFHRAPRLRLQHGWNKQAPE